MKFVVIIGIATATHDPIEKEQGEFPYEFRMTNPGTGSVGQLVNGNGLHHISGPTYLQYSVVFARYSVLH